MRTYQKLRGKCQTILEKWPSMFHWVLQHRHHPLEQQGAPSEGDSQHSLCLLYDEECTLVVSTTGATSNLEDGLAPSFEPTTVSGSNKSSGSMTDTTSDSNSHRANKSGMKTTNPCLMRRLFQSLHPHTE